MSAEQTASRVGLSVAAIRSYERADRHPTVMVLEKILNLYGHTLVVVPLNAEAPRVRVDMVADLRAIAKQLEGLDPASFD